MRCSTQWLAVLVVLDIALATPLPEPDNDTATASGRQPASLSRSGKYNTWPQTKGGADPTDVQCPEYDLWLGRYCHARNSRVWQDDCMVLRPDKKRLLGYKRTYEAHHGRCPEDTMCVQTWVKGEARIACSKDAVFPWNAKKSDQDVQESSIRFYRQYGFRATNEMRLGSENSASFAVAYRVELLDDMFTTSITGAMIDPNTRRTVRPAVSELFAVPASQSDAPPQLCNAEGVSGILPGRSKPRDRPFDLDVPHMCLSSQLYDFYKGDVVYFIAALDKQQMEARLQFFYLFEELIKNDPRGPKKFVLAYDGQDQD